MKFELTLGDWATLQAAAKGVRHEVFICEQNIPVALEWDEMDALSLHAVAWDETGHPLATGRLLGRMAVKKAARGAGIGGAILGALMLQAKRRGDSAVMLNAQVHAEAFYTRHGFEREGEEFMEADIPHICMRHDLQNIGHEKYEKAS